MQIQVIQNLSGKIENTLNREIETLFGSNFSPTTKTESSSHKKEEIKEEMKEEHNVKISKKKIKVDPKIIVDRTSFIQLASEMINSGEVETSIEFLNTFMFVLDAELEFHLNIDFLIERQVFMTKEEAKQELYRNFVENVDYKIRITRKSETPETIVLSTDCFKSLSQMSMNEMGIQTRLYYQGMEKVFRKYSEIEYRNKLDEQQNEIRRISRNHNMIVKKRTCFRFKTGLCMYLISFSGKHKFGYSDDMNKVLVGERRMEPLLKVELLIYSPDAYRLEQTMLLKYAKNLERPNHEIVVGVSTDILIESTRKVVEILQLEHQEEDDLSKYNDAV